MPGAIDYQALISRLNLLNDDEERRLSPTATLSRQAIRRRTEEREGYRQQFALDADRILHSRAYTRYIDKTQVFSLIDNDHITHRVLHVQLVARVARTIGRFLHLNEDLIEAIALGHDIGHPPFGHEGEHVLSELCQEHGLPAFQHNIQSIRFLDMLERKGRGWNLCLQTLDGILCHDGEIHSRSLQPDIAPTFDDFETRLAAKEKDPTCLLYPATTEGCVVRLADTISYIGRDIEDAIVLGLIRREDIPERCRTVLGDSNGTIVYNLVTDLLTASTVPPPGDRKTQRRPIIGFGQETAEALAELKAFNYQQIYLADETRKYFPLIRECYSRLFRHYLAHLQRPGEYQLQVDLMTDMDRPYLETQSPEEMVRDFIAGMTDAYFLRQAAAIGCAVPEKR
jgi:dGTPase